jgi:CubicO group peptidase (beta-lactamase class C family)
MGASSATPSPHQLQRSDLEPWLDGYMSYALRSGDIAGAVVVVVKNGTVLTARGYGFADVAAHRPVDPERTLFRVGSISKLFTWTAVMQQVEDGQLDLDRDVNAYLDFTIPPFHGQPITLRELMTHTAGFALAGKDTITFGPPIPLGPFLKRWIPERIYAPGTTPAYSNWGAALAGYIVQRSSHMPFDDYVQKRILDPLRMNRATFRQPLPGSYAPFMSKGYIRGSNPALPYEIIGPAPAGALAASGRDMSLFMIAHLDNGHGILKPETAAKMQDSPLDRINPEALMPTLNRMQLGFIGMDINGHRVVGHGGDTQQFHSLLALFPDDQVGLFLSLNSAGRDGAANDVRNRLFEEFADRYFPGGATYNVQIPSDVARQHARMMTGFWLGSGQAQGSFLALAGLVGQTKVALADNGTLSIPSLKDARGAEQKWDEVAPFIWKSRFGHERIAARVVGGKVVRWAIDSSAPIQVYQRVRPSRSAAWIVPALVASLLILLLTILYWPAAWVARRRYRAEMVLQGSALHAYRFLRLFSMLELIVLGGWIVLLATMLSDLDWIGHRSDPWLLLLEISGWIVFNGTVLLAGWNAWLTTRDKRHWPRQLWSIMVLVAAGVVLYVSYTFGLLATGTNY